ncbi:hypothetical protein GCM10009784_18360 [Arthrobacter parietis]|uniref:Uncharacterized protein n=1 Tax=Arthrobacter parietis TaxID=271434 RepID=A0ABN3AW42_9MICC
MVKLTGFEASIASSISGGASAADDDGTSEGVDGGVGATGEGDDEAVCGFPDGSPPVPQEVKGRKRSAAPAVRRRRRSRALLFMSA